MQQPHPGNENRFAVVQASGDDGQDRVRDPLGAGAPQRIGWFRFYFDDGRWEWSPQVEKMHGYRPGSVTPTTEMVLTHKHPDDYRQIADTLDLIRQTRQAFSSRHRIIDVQGRVHHVVVVGDLLREIDGTVIGTHGYYVDVTPSEREHQDQVTAAVAVIAESRADIERTKGMLMLIYGMDEPAAFELLKWRSQETNTKLRLLAAQIAADFVALSGSRELPRSIRLRQTAIDRTPPDRCRYRVGERYRPTAIRRHRIGSARYWAGSSLQLSFIRPKWSGIDRNRLASPSTAKRRIRLPFKRVRHVTGSAETCRLLIPRSQVRFLPGALVRGGFQIRPRASIGAYSSFMAGQCPQLPRRRGSNRSANWVNTRPRLM